MPKIAIYPKVQKNIEPDWELIKPRKNGSVTKMPTVANNNIRVCQRPNKVGVIRFWILDFGFYSRRQKEEGRRPFDYAQEPHGFVYNQPGDLLKIHFNHCINDRKTVNFATPAALAVARLSTDRKPAYCKPKKLSTGA
jgi:hypothetical protein